VLLHEKPALRASTFSEEARVACALLHAGA
jgi:hypothetical protein